MVFKKGQNQAHKSIKELKEFAERLERTDWALLDYIKQQEFVIQSLEKRLYNVEKFVTTFAAAIEEK